MKIEYIFLYITYWSIQIFYHHWITNLRRNMPTVKIRERYVSKEETKRMSCSNLRMLLLRLMFLLLPM